MKIDLKGKRALITASSRGLGYAAARELGAVGADLVICSRNQKNIEDAASLIMEETGASVLPVQADISLKQDIERIVKICTDKFESIDVLVNNAGGPPSTSLGDTTEKQWKDAFESLLMSVVRLTTSFVPVMKRRGWGRIINITSVSVKQPLPGLLLSNTLRAGIAGFAKSAALETAAYGVTINNVCPGMTKTERLKELAETISKMENKEAADVYRQWEEDIPAGRLGKPEELASLIAFLASDAAAYINGSTLCVDGGFVRSLL